MLVQGPFASYGGRLPHDDAPGALRRIMGVVDGRQPHPGILTFEMVTRAGWAMRLLGERPHAMGLAMRAFDGDRTYFFVELVVGRGWGPERADAWLAHRWPDFWPDVGADRLRPIVESGSWGTAQ